MNLLPILIRFHATPTLMSRKKCVLSSLPASLAMSSIVRSTTFSVLSPVTNHASSASVIHHRSLAASFLTNWMSPTFFILVWKVGLEIPSEVYIPQKNGTCPTLFVANIGSNGSEKELTQVFSSSPGFLRLKMQNKKGAPVAFIDFQDVACSTKALNHLQGFVLHSSEGEGMRLEYAKSRMGLRKQWRN